MFVWQQSIICLAITLIAYIIKPTNSLARAEWKRCASSESKLETFWGISVQECAKKCDVRHDCFSINYLTRGKICEFLTTNYWTEGITTPKRPCVHIARQNLPSKQCLLKNCTNKEESCNVKACPVPVVATNAEVLGNIYTVRSRIKVKCSEGHRMVTDPLPIRCGANGQWTNLDFPNCSASCPDPLFVMNADVSPGNNSIGEVRNYFCRQETVLLPLDGAVTTTICLRNNTWRTTNFQCLKDCGEPVNLGNAFIGPGQNTETSERYYKCNEGYGTPLNTTYVIITCQKNGTWTLPSTDCIENAAGQNEYMSFTFGFMLNYNTMSEPIWKVYVVSSYPTKFIITSPLQQFQEEVEVRTGTEVTIPGNLKVLNGIGYFPCGFHLESHSPVVVYVENVASTSAGGGVVIPDKRLSTEYVLLSWNDYPGKTYKAEFTVIGTVDNTTVEITLVDGSRYFLTLNKYQVYHRITLEELSGTYIWASEHVAVFAGHECTNLITKFCDHLNEQMPPIRDLQTEFIVSFPYPRHDYALRIMAIEDNTKVSLSNGTSVILNHIQYAQFRFYHLPVGITATKKIMVAVYSLGRESRPKGFPTTFDGSMLIVPGISQFRPEYDIYVPAGLAKCVLMVTFPSYASSTCNIRLNHQQFIANESVDVNMIGRGTYTVLYTELQKGTSVIYTTDGTPFGAYLSFFRDRAESWFSLAYTF